MKKVGQIPTITPLRGFAALFVAVFHIRMFLPNLDLSFFLPFVNRSYLWVDFFFVLSGFIMCHVYASTFQERFSFPEFKRFVILRFARVVPLHVFVLALFVVTEYGLLALSKVIEQNVYFWPFLFTTKEPVYTFFTNLFLVQSMHFHERLTWNIPAWSLSVEWYAYMVFPFIVGPLLRLGVRTTLGLASVFFACLWGMTQLRQGSLDFTYDFGFIRCLLEFSIGILFYRIFEEVNEKGLPYSGPLFVASLIAIPFVMQFSPSDAWLIPLFALVILTGAANRGGIERALNGSFLSFLGEVSYSVYMIHFLLLRWVFSAWRYLFNEPFGPPFDQAQSLVAMAVLVCLTVVCAGLTQRWIEVPARRWIRNHWVS